MTANSTTHATGVAVARVRAGAVVMSLAGLAVALPACPYGFDTISRADVA